MMHDAEFYSKSTHAWPIPTKSTKQNQLGRGLLRLAQTVLSMKLCFLNCTTVVMLPFAQT